MLCEHYKEALIEAASSDVPPPGDLRAHLDGCAACRAAFEQEQALLASIDGGLRVTANAAVPASLLPRVRAQLSGQSVARRSWVPAWAVVVTTAAMVLAVFAVRGRRHDASGQDPQKSILAHAPLPVEIPARPLGASPQTEPGLRMKELGPHSRAQTSPSVERVPVLLPADQRVVIDAWLDGLRTGKLKADNLLAQKSDLSLQDLRVSPLDVSPIELKPLADVSGESPPQDGEAKR
jgi:hypothetical protein